jgi:hypothetical protein
MHKAAPPWGAEQRRRITLGVLQNIYGQLANISSRRLDPSTTDDTKKALDEDHAVLSEMLKLLESGDDLAITKHPRLAMMRELVIGGITLMLRDGEYVLTDRKGWFICGPASVNISQSDDGNSVKCSVYPLLRESSKPLASVSITYEKARLAAEALE